MVRIKNFCKNGLSKELLLLSLLFLFLVVPKSVFALGGMPAGKLVDFSPGKTLSYDFYVLNNEGKQQVINLRTQVDEGINLVLSESRLVFSEGEEKKMVRATLTLPEKMSPGEHLEQIIIEEKGSQQQNIINSLPAVLHTIKVRVPYPGKYLEGVLEVLLKDPDKDVPVALSVYNAGKETINKADLIVDVYGPTNELITTIKGSAENIKGGEERKITVLWPGKKNPGKYYLKAILTYDDQDPRIFEKVFELGKPRIIIGDVAFKNFKLGEITKLEIAVRNLWNQPLKDAFAKIIVEQSGTKVAEFNSLPADLDPYVESTLEAFWDTEGLTPGTYDLRIITEYSGGREEKLVPVVLQPDEARVIKTGLAVSGGEDASSNSLILIAIIALLIMNIGLFYYVRKNMNKK